MDSSSSYLEPTKLFAIVDLDLQVQNINNNYLFSDTEAIFCNLYEKTKINESKALQHRIWVTGFIHKEAYFLVPKLQTIFDQFPIGSIFNNKKLILEDIYLNMSTEIINDADLQSNFHRVCTRISYCDGLDLSEIDKLRNSWINQFQLAQSTMRKNELVFTLLTIRKSKAYWNQIQPTKEWTRPISAFKDQLLLEIGRFYSEQTDATQYHIPSFFKILYQFV
jgi:hypothetical protein